MATTTTTYKFKKPEQTDNYYIDDQNQNWDKTEAAIKAEAAARVNAISAETFARTNADSARLTLELKRLNKRFENAGMDQFLIHLERTRNFDAEYSGAFLCDFNEKATFTDLGNRIWVVIGTSVSMNVRAPATTVNYTFPSTFNSLYFYLQCQTPNDSTTVNVFLSFDNGSSWQSPTLIKKFRNSKNTYYVNMYKLNTGGAQRTVRVKLDAYSLDGNFLLRGYGLYPDDLD